MERSQSPFDPDLEATGELLRVGRPQLSAPELDRVKQGVYARRRHDRDWAPSRLAAVAVVSLGLLAGTSGVALGVAAVTVPSDNAAAVEYPPLPPPPTTTPPEPPGGGVEGENGTGHNGNGGNGGNGGNPDQGGVEAESGGGTSGSGDQASAAPTSSGRVLQPARQLATVRAASLPFTGYLALPALAVGALLTGSGLLLLRRQRRRQGW